MPAVIFHGEETAFMSSYSHLHLDDLLLCYLLLSLTQPNQLPPPPPAPPHESTADNAAPAAYVL